MQGEEGTFIVATAAFNSNYGRLGVPIVFVPVVRGAVIHLRARQSGRQ